MKTPLRYQVTEYDCGPTALLNAISYLYERDEVPAGLVRNIMLYSLDCYNEQGEEGKNGTSTVAMMFLSSWLNQYATVHRFPLNCRYLRGEGLRFEPGAELNAALENGSAVVARVWDECEHYILITGLDGERLRIFDPYYQTEPFAEEEIQIVLDKPFTYNRLVPQSFLNSCELTTYAMGCLEKREAILLTRESCGLAADPAQS